MGSTTGHPMQRPSRRWHARRGAAAILGLVSFFVAGSRGEEPQADNSADLARYDARVKAEDREHWAFQPVVEPEVPAVKDSAWVRNPIDAFVLAELEAQGWKPAPPAEPRRLLRRVYLDLIGLPPTPEEQRGVPGRPLARCAGPPWSTSCWHAPRTASAGGGTGSTWSASPRPTATSATPPSRTPGATATTSSARSTTTSRSTASSSSSSPATSCPTRAPRRSIATGYYRLGPWDDEPADPKQDRFDQLDDMVGTTSEVFLGLTLACARCHNHKFEPLTALDYYRMVAVFNPLERPATAGPSSTSPPARRRRSRPWPSATGGSRRSTAGSPSARSWRSSYLHPAGAAPRRGGRGVPRRAGPADRGPEDARDDHRRRSRRAGGHAPDEDRRPSSPTRRRSTAPRRHARPAARLLPARADRRTRRRRTCCSAARRRPPGPEVEPGLPAVLVAAQPAFPAPAGLGHQRAAAGAGPLARQPRATR